MPTSSGTRTVPMAGRKPTCRCGSRCRNRSRRSSAAHAILAILLASAIATPLVGRRASEDWPFYSITLSLQHPRFAERDFMEYQADGSRSLQFDPRKLDHLGPFLSIRGYEFSELVGRQRH